MGLVSHDQKMVFKTIEKDYWIYYHTKMASEIIEIENLKPKWYERELPFLNLV